MEITNWFYISCIYVVNCSIVTVLEINLLVLYFIKLLQKQIAIKSFEAHCHIRLFKRVNVAQTTSIIIIRVLLRLDTQAVRNKQQYHANAYGRSWTNRVSGYSQQTATPSPASVWVFLFSVSITSLWGAQIDLTWSPPALWCCLDVNAFLLLYSPGHPYSSWSYSICTGCQKYFTRRYPVRVLPQQWKLVQSITCTITRQKYFVTENELTNQWFPLGFPHSLPSLAYYITM